MWSIPFLLSLTSLLPIVFCDNGLIIQTTSGEVHGFINQSTPLVRQFLGVPYAEPPLGDLRFVPPQTKEMVGSSMQQPSRRPACNNSTTAQESIRLRFPNFSSIEGIPRTACIFTSGLLH